jgi:hypothetical protein
LGTGDFNGDGTSDILWRHSGGTVAIWEMEDGKAKTSIGLGTVDSSWTFADIGDYNGDGTSDILWRHSGGTAAIWEMDTGGVSQSLGLGTISTDWQIVSHASLPIS